MRWPECRPATGCSQGAAPRPGRNCHGAPTGRICLWRRSVPRPSPTFTFASVTGEWVSASRTMTWTLRQAGGAAVGVAGFSSGFSGRDEVLHADKSDKLKTKTINPSVTVCTALGRRFMLWQTPGIGPRAPKCAAQRGLGMGADYTTASEYLTRHPAHGIKSVEPWVSQRVVRWVIPGEDAGRVLDGS